jgi:hypothetical protein
MGNAGFENLVQSSLFLALGLLEENFRFQLIVQVDANSSRKQNQTESNGIQFGLFDRCWPGF